MVSDEKNSSFHHTKASVVTREAIFRVTTLSSMCWRGRPSCEKFTALFPVTALTKVWLCRKLSFASPHCNPNAACILQVEEGKTYAWCTCGRSAKQPFCDGSHKGTEFKSLKWTADKTGKVRIFPREHRQAKGHNPLLQDSRDANSLLNAIRGEAKGDKERGWDEKEHLGAVGERSR